MLGLVTEGLANGTVVEVGVGGLAGAGLVVGLAGGVLVMVPLLFV